MLFAFKGFTCGCSDPLFGVVQADDQIQANDLATARLGREGYWLETLEEIKFDELGTALVLKEEDDQDGESDWPDFEDWGDEEGADLSGGFAEGVNDEEVDVL